MLDIHLKPEPLEFEAVQFALLDLQATVSGADAGAQSAAVTSSSSSSRATDNSSTSSSGGVEAALNDSSNIPNSSSSSSDMGDSSSRRESRGPVIYLKRASVGANSASASSSSNSTSSSASTCLHPGQCVGYIRIVGFSSTTPQLVSEALTSLKDQGIQGWVLDLRANPGGLVDAGLEVAEDFLKSGDVLCYAAARDGLQEEVRLPTSHVLTEAPVVSLRASRPGMQGVHRVHVVRCSCLSACLANYRRCMSMALRGSASTCHW